MKAGSYASAAALLVSSVSCEKVAGLDDFETRDTFPPPAADASEDVDGTGGSVGDAGGNPDSGTGGIGGSGGTGGEAGDASAGGTGGAPACAPPCPAGATCDNGTCNCPVAATTVCADTCVDLQTSLSHCGSCGAACAGTCTAGRCKVEYTRPGGSIGQHFALDATHIYAIDFGGVGPRTVYSQALSDKSVVILAEGAGVSAARLAVNSTHVFWVDTEVKGVKKVSKSGGTPVTVAAYFAGTPVTIAVDETNVIWTDLGDDATPADGSLNRVPVGGGGPTTLASGFDFPKEIALNATTVCCADIDAGTITCVPIAGGTPQTLVSGQDLPGAVALTADTLYWTTEGSGMIMSVPLAGGTPTTIASGYNTPRGIAVDDAHVYWSSDYDGVIAKAPRGGGQAMVVATDMPNLYQVEVDATSVYWAKHVYVARLTPK